MHLPYRKLPENRFIFKYLEIIPRCEFIRLVCLQNKNVIETSYKLTISFIPQNPLSNKNFHNIDLLHNVPQNHYFIRTLTMHISNPSTFVPLCYTKKSFC